MNTKELASETRKYLKEKYPNFKFSVRSKDYNSIYVDLMEAPFDVFTDNAHDETKESGYISLNQFNISQEDRLVKEARDMFVDIRGFVNKDNYTVVEDGDYGSVPSYYENYGVGQWDKPFKIVERSDKSYSTSLKNKPNASNLELDIEKTKDTRDDSDIWVLRIKSKLDRDEFKSIANSFRGAKNKGYYSKFVKGFIFRDELTEDMAKDILGGGASVDADKTEVEEQTKESSKDYEFTYSMLGRMKSDNEYFLGNEGQSRHVKHLQQGSVDEQISEMKRLWNSLPDDKKPEWLSMDDIRDYERRMTQSPDTISGGLADNKTPEQIANKHGKDLGWFMEQLEAGIKVEMEHTDDREKSKEIALDHLFESAYYYIELEKMEEELDEEKEKEDKNKRDDNLRRELLLHYTGSEKGMYNNSAKYKQMGDIELRISDHSARPKNQSEFEISVVTHELDPTTDKFLSDNINVSGLTKEQAVNLIDDAIKSKYFEYKEGKSIEDVSDLKETIETVYGVFDLGIIGEDEIDAIVDTISKKDLSFNESDRDEFEEIISDYVNKIEQVENIEVNFIGENQEESDNKEKEIGSKEKPISIEGAIEKDGFLYKKIDESKFKENKEMFNPRFPDKIYGELDGKPSVFNKIDGNIYENIGREEDLKKQDNKELLPKTKPIKQYEQGEYYPKETPIMIEWSEGFPEENIFLKNLDQLNEKLIEAGFTEQPYSTYIKNKVHFIEHGNYTRIDSSKSEGDFDFETHHIRDWLKSNDKGIYEQLLSYDKEILGSGYKEDNDSENEDLSVKSVKKYKSSTMSDAYDFVRNIQTYSYEVTFSDGTTEYLNAKDKEEAKEMAISKRIGEPKPSEESPLVENQEWKDLKELCIIMGDYGEWNDLKKLAEMMIGEE